jgi:hypothetical protein
MEVLENEEREDHLITDGLFLRGRDGKVEVGARNAPVGRRNPVAVRFGVACLKPFGRGGARRDVHRDGCHGFILARELREWQGLDEHGAG